MVGQWYYRIGGEEYGPIPRYELDALIRSGTLGGSHLVRAATGTDWQRVDVIRGSGGTGGGDAWSDTVREALIVQRAKDLKHRGRRPIKEESSRPSLGKGMAGLIGFLVAPFQLAASCMGRLGRPIDWLAETFSDFRDRQSVQITIRVSCVVVSVAIAALIVREWSGYEALRDLSHRGPRVGLQSPAQEPSTTRFLPLVGPCGETAYWITLTEVLVVVAVIAYIASGWFLSAEDE